MLFCRKVRIQKIGEIDFAHVKFNFAKVKLNFTKSDFNFLNGNLNFCEKMKFNFAQNKYDFTKYELNFARKTSSHLLLSHIYYMTTLGLRYSYIHLV